MNSQHKHKLSPHNVNLKFGIHLHGIIKWDFRIKVHALNEYVTLIIPYCEMRMNVGSKL